MASLLTRLAQSSTSRSSSILSLSRTMSTQRATLNLKNPSLLKSKAFVNNEWVSSKSGKVFQVTNPANNEVIGEVPEMGNEEEVEEVIAVAKKAFETWRHSTPKSRQDLLAKFHKLMLDNTDDLATIITAENGKPLPDARGEHLYSSSFLEWFSAEAMRNYGDTIPSTIPGLRNVTIKQPVGVVGVITPWNFPSAMITRKIAPALAAGCTCVIKVPEETPFSGLALMELAQQAGFPPGVLNVITSQDSPKVGQVICASKTIKKVSFTGSTGVGKILAKQCAGTLKKLSFELGGNAPFIVFDDADIDAAVTGAIACKFRSSGQTCVCANRIYVQDGVYDEFSKKLVEAVKKFKVGNGADEGVTHGPLIHGRALAKVEDHVKDAVDKGANLLLGGSRLTGPEYPSENYYEPTIIGDVPEDAACLQEETFGPMAAVVRFKSEEEVLRLANDTDVGLAGYFFSRDVGRVWRVAEALEVGMVGCNTGLISQASIPFGGVKESGYGREGSKYGMADYEVIKVICMGGLGTN
ncbi:hypothetical protein FFLO_02572 [Filobasidium floriforme]|uniref:Succinate-semialdehyde dehydrogenase n=1 Tax=Filobasidium floriforme TaxID=5210 RepID=A0A8K0JNR1_9TREE|nr:hypothetical protein FFLO_02572 [Filobasidium floriforme]